jgi:ATP synthase F1 gamma subunit
MRQPLEILQEVQTMSTVGQLTGAFEGIASMHIAEIKDQVAQSKAFFEDLWQIYTQLRVGKEFYSGIGYNKKAVINKELIIVVTSDESLSGDIDQRVIDNMLDYYDKKRNDIIVIGFHGAHQLRQVNVAFEKEFKLPESDQKIDFSSIVAEIQKYNSCRVYYQTYISLAHQEIKNIELNKAVKEQGEATSLQSDYINAETYIQEPSVFEVVNYMERSMLQVTVAQVVLESKLAQYASRFSAMSMAHSKADDASSELNLELNHAKRALKDERTREIISGLRKERIRA